MFVVSGDHLLEMVVVVAVDADVLPAADPVAGIGHGVGDWRVGLSPAPDCWIPADRYAMLEMAPLPFRATPRKRTAPRAGVATQRAGLGSSRSAQLGQGWNWRKGGGWEEFGERSLTAGRVTRDRAGGNRVALVSARPVAEG